MILLLVQVIYEDADEEELVKNEVVLNLWDGPVPELKKEQCEKHRQNMDFNDEPTVELASVVGRQSLPASKSSHGSLGGSDGAGKDAAEMIGCVLERSRGKTGGLKPVSNASSTNAVVSAASKKRGRPGKVEVEFPSKHTREMTGMEDYGDVECNEIISIHSDPEDLPSQPTGATSSDGSRFLSTKVEKACKQSPTQSSSSSVSN